MNDMTDKNLLGRLIGIIWGKVDGLEIGPSGIKIIFRRKSGVEEERARQEAGVRGHGRSAKDLIS